MGHSAIVAYHPVEKEAFESVLLIFLLNKRD